MNGEFATPPAQAGDLTTLTATVVTNTANIVTNTAAIAADQWKAACRVASLANLTLSAAQTIDGVSIIAGDRVLVAGQTTGADNGIYVCASGAWARATDADVSAEVVTGMTVRANEGTANSGAYLLATTGAITLGSTSLSFQKTGATVAIRAHTGTSDTTVLADAGKLVTNSNASVVTQTIPANSSVPYVVGTVIQFAQLGAGQATIALTTDTLRVPTGFLAKIRGQYCTVTATKIASTEWLLAGDLSFV